MTSDELLSKAVNDRISNLPNVSILASIEELKGLINTLVSDVDEEFIARLKPKAARLFFTSKDDKDALFYKEDVRGQIAEKFKVELAARPEGTTFRSDGTWRISQPNFARKVGRRIFWTSRIEIDVEAGNVTIERESAVSFFTPLAAVGSITSPFISGMVMPQPSSHGTAQSPHYLSALNSLQNINSAANLLASGLPSESRVVTQKGRDVYEVLWNAEVTLAKELRKALIDDIKHIDINWRPIS